MAKDGPRIQDTTLSDLLDMLASAVVIVNAEGRILFANRGAQAMFESRFLLCRQRGQLRTPIASASESLAVAIREAANGKAPTDSSVIALPSVSDQPAIAYVMPLVRSTAELAAVIVASFRSGPMPTSSALAALYKLTPTETRVMLAIASGQNRTETAAMLGVAGSTVKTHLTRIFAKTRTSEQAELTKLVLRLSCPFLLEP